MPALGVGLRGSFSAIASIISCTSLTRASELEATAFSVEYAAAPACPSQAEFEAEVVSRVPGASVVAYQEAKVRFRVRLATDGEGTPSRIWIELPDGTTTEREVLDAACSEAAASMIVIAAMVLDAYRKAQAEPAPQPVPSATAQEEPLSRPPQPVDSTAVVDQRPAQRPSDAHARVGVALGAGFEHAVAPVAPIGALAGVELSFVRPGIWSPALRLSVLYTADATETTAQGAADFSLITGRLALCPLRLGALRSLGLLVCAELDAGELKAVGSGETRNPRRQAMVWLAAGGALRVELPIGSSLELEATAALRGLYFHDRFVLNPEAVLHDVPPLSVGLGVGMVARSW